MLQPRTQRNLLIGVLWLAIVATSASAIPAVSAGFDTNQVAMPTAGFSVAIDRGISSELTAEELAATGEFTQAVMGDNRLRTELSEGSAFLSEVVVAPVDQTPSEGKVPEPATLVLLGSGLIAVASASRRKRPWWKFGRVSAARIRYRLAQEF